MSAARVSPAAVPTARAVTATTEGVASSGESMSAAAERVAAGKGMAASVVWRATPATERMKSSGLLR